MIVLCFLVVGIFGSVNTTTQNATANVTDGTVNVATTTLDPKYDTQMISMADCDKELLEVLKQNITDTINGLQSLKDEVNTVILRHPQKKCGRYFKMGPCNNEWLGECKWDKLWDVCFLKKPKNDDDDDDDDDDTARRRALFASNIEIRSQATMDEEDSFEEVSVGACGIKRILDRKMKALVKAQARLGGWNSNLLKNCKLYKKLKEETRKKGNNTIWFPWDKCKKKDIAVEVEVSQTSPERGNIRVFPDFMLIAVLLSTAVLLVLACSSCAGPGYWMKLEGTHELHELPDFENTF